MIKNLPKILRQKKQWLSEIIPLRLKAIKHGIDLKVKQNNIKNIKKNNIILFAVMKNEAHRLNFFLDYYRKMGVDHFILVDNDSNDNFEKIVYGQEDITTFFTAASYKDANYGMHWMNYLLWRYGCGHWCITCDPDEFLVYPYIETRDLRDLTNYLDSLQVSSFFSIMIDMYSDNSVEQSYYLEGTDPIQTCPYFDGTGYSRTYSSYYRNMYLQGGVRRRVFYTDSPQNSPALNKVPLVKWQSHFAYIESMHMAVPRRLNEVCSKNNVTGALLHFKFISQLVDKVQEESAAKQHWDNSSEYKKYDEAIRKRTMLYNSSVSVRYEDWRTLARLGLLNTGEW